MPFAAIFAQVISNLCCEKYVLLLNHQLMCVLEGETDRRATFLTVARFRRLALTANGTCALTQHKETKRACLKTCTNIEK